MDFVSSSPFSLLPPFFKMFIIIRFSSFDNISRRHNTVSVEQLWTKNTRIIHDVWRLLILSMNKNEWIWKFWKRVVVEKRGGGEEETKSMLHAPVLSPKIIEHKKDNDMWRWNRHKTVAGLNRLLDNILMWLSRKLLCWFITVYSHFIMTTKLNEVEGNTNSYDSYRWITLTSHG